MFELREPFDPAAIAEDRARRIADVFGLFGPPERCAERLLQACEEAGVEEVFLFPAHDLIGGYQMPDAELEAFARVIRPVWTRSALRSLAMAILDYPRHFVLLVGAAALLALGLTVQAPWSPVVDRLFVIFGLSGALHAVAVVLALRANASWPSRVGFVVAAAVVSIAAALGGLGLAGLLHLNLTLTVFLALAFTSAFGAAWYWLLVRSFWAPFLSRGSLLVTIGACVLAALIAALAGGAGHVPRDPFVSVLWWVGFSTSLYVADRRRTSPGPGR